MCTVKTEEPFPMLYYIARQNLGTILVIFKNEYLTFTISQHATEGQHQIF